MKKTRKAIIRKGLFYVYIIECKYGTYYTGYTNDLGKRLKEHNEGKRGAKYTRGRGPVKLVWKKKYKLYINAVREEARIKKLRRYQKEILVNEYKQKL